MGARIAALGTLVLTGVIIADILIHPEGTKAASNGLAAILTPSYNAMLGSPG